MFARKQIDDIDLLYAGDTTAWDFEYLQLTPGRLAFRSEVVELPGLLIEWNSFGQHVLFRDRVRDERVLLAVMLDAERTPRTIVRSTRQVLGAILYDEKARVDSVADSVGVSQRTLFEAFRSYLGIGPYEYQLLRRLHDFRHALLASPTGRGKIAECALATGFTHFGRLSEWHKRHFGETPRDLLKRRLKQPAEAAHGT